MTFVFSRSMWYYFISLHLKAGTGLDSRLCLSSDLDKHRGSRGASWLSAVRPFPVWDIRAAASWSSLHKLFEVQNMWLQERISSLPGTICHSEDPGVEHFSKVFTLMGDVCAYHLKIVPSFLSCLQGMESLGMVTGSSSPLQFSGTEVDVT